jgi:hypothetical protein
MSLKPQKNTPRSSEPWRARHTRAHELLVFPKWTPTANLWQPAVSRKTPASERRTRTASLLPPETPRSRFCAHTYAEAALLGFSKH